VGLLDKRLVFVTGKGGVGKSTVATALGQLAARYGRRTVVVELARQEEVDHGLAEVQLDDGLYTIAVDPQHAMAEYLHLKAGAVGHVLNSSRLFHALAMATPGLPELLSLGKVWELSQRERRSQGAGAYDFVVVDAPATGHGVGFLRTPRTFADIARVGPIARQARTIANTLDDHDFTAVVAVCMPEEMAVNETLALDAAIGELGLELAAVVLNAVYPARFDERELTKLEEALAAATTPLARSAVRAALSEHARAESQFEQVERLRSELDRPLIELPYLFCERVGPEELGQLTDVLEPALTDEASLG
jgi:anion-transporting  ArsA/GET3 family ATPase